MASPRREEVAGRPAGKPKSSSTAAEISKDNRGWRKRGSEGEGVRMGAKE